MSQPDNSNSPQDYYNLLLRLRRDLQLDLSTDVQPNTRLVLPAYVAPTLTAHWPNLGGANDTAAFYIDNVGVVHLNGSLNGSAGVVNNDVIFTLPAGYRPRRNRSFAVYDSVTGTSPITVTSAGQVVYFGAAGARIISLDSISFRADQ